MSDKIREYFDKNEFKIINGKIDGVDTLFVTDKTNKLYVEVESEKVEDPEEFEEKVLDFRDYFGNAQYISRIRNENYYLYEVYLN